ncbi:queuosine precursor transporter [Sphingosinicella soli]|uniref:Probable queuosine precursor transporter n=1 Tax=Sphingosinicella soli TaxID=333708 RepID=A0A7W7B1N0_9SPHN|nr:queuosine precursor transporter [Sphingosinicella soli]MBB4632379.1 hypothetical protein [Sphingosinicella soli]
MTTPTPPISRSLFAFSVLYGGMACIAGVLGNKQIALGPLTVEAGIFAFLLLVVLSSATAELHGRKAANHLVFLGFVPLVVSMVLIVSVLALPAAPEMDAERLAGFQTILAQSPRLMGAGIVAYGISQLLNVGVFSLLRREGGWLWLRSALASVLSQIIDTLIFITLAFYGLFPILDLMIGQMLAKIMLSIVLVPPLVQGFVAIGRKLDARG